MRLLAILCCLILLGLAGCAFQRSDFVCGPDGKPEGELSSSAKMVGAVAGGPKVRINY